jgi:hypothetical protein
MWAYLANSLAWSALGLVIGAGLTEAGYDLTRFLTGRRNRDDT